MLITSIEIAGLRGIRGGRVKKLAPLTILLGANGSGKSTVLEGVGLVCSGSDAVAAFGVLSAREWLGIEGMQYWVDQTTGATVDAELDGAIPPWSPNLPLTEIRVTVAPLGRDTGGASIRTEAKWPSGASSTGPTHIDSDGNISGRSGASLAPFVLETTFVNRPAGAQARFAATRFSSALREAMSTIKRTAWYDDMFSYLQELRPRLTSIESLAVGDRDEPHMFEKDPREVYPVAYAGDGFRRSLLIAAAFARAKGGVVAIDEPEAFAHPKLFAVFTRLVKRAIADGTQVFFATQSLEFVGACLAEFTDDPSKVVIVGVALERGVLDPTVIAGADARDRVIEYGDDLRL